MPISAAELPGRIEALPGMARLLAAASGLEPMYLVGGAVRDLLRGGAGVDLDVAVEGDAPATARALAERLGGAVSEHERFGTATLRAADLVVDFATTRRDRYARPGALPDVEPAPLGEDLARRDFAINAIAATLAPPELGRLIDPHGGVPDLDTGTVRVLHEQSFIDDPTRLLRAVRYEVRLGFAMDAATEALARAAAADGAPRTVSGARVGDELLDLLAEPEAAAGVVRLRDLGLDRALHADLVADPELVASAALGAAQSGADRVLAALAALVSSAPAALGDWLASLGLRGADRERVARAAAGALPLAAWLRDARRPSELRRRLDAEPAEALALALARGAPAEPILRYMSDLRDVRLEVTGDDLLTAGVPASPAVGHALERTLALKLDGAVSGREDELRAALTLARTHPDEAP